MAEKTFTLEVITPDRKVLSDSEVVAVLLPGVEGYLGVLANHEPLVTEITIGELDYRRADGKTDIMAITGGFVEVFENKVTVLADSAETRTEIDLKRAEEALQRAKERLSSAGSDLDEERARIALMRAINRLRVAQKPM